MQNRTTVLAHKRFLEEQASLMPLDLAARFAWIERHNMWGAASVSGLGSEPETTHWMRDELLHLVQRLGIRSILDAPCGDSGWIGPLAERVDYTGVDIVPSLVEAGRQRVARGAFRGRFVLADITRDALPCADLILCRDCLVHLSFAHVRQALARFKPLEARGC